MKKQLNSTLAQLIGLFCMVMLLTSFNAASAAKPASTEFSIVRIDAFKAMEIRVYKANAQNAFRLAVSNPSGDKFTLKIRNEKNELIWWSNVQGSLTYTKLISLAKLNAGTYLLEVSNDQTSYTKDIEVK
jgi:hypothetical protein